MKRFQESNKLIQIWRYRWYLLIPFKFVYFTYFSPFKVYDGDDKSTQKKYDILKGKKLWKILIGDAQSNMKWHYTYEEVMSDIKELKLNKIKINKNGKK